MYETNLPSTRISRARESLRLASLCETWRPEPNSDLAGVIVGGRMQDGPYCPGRQMLVQTEQGNIIAVWLNVHLEKQLRVQEAETGDVVAIWYGGQARSNSALRKSKIAP